MEGKDQMTVDSKGSDRKIFLDQLRVLATCAVVLLHTVTGAKDNTPDMFYWFPGEFRIFLAVLDLVTWCVPIFVIISGYLFLDPSREFSMKKMIVKYCRRIVLALVLFGVPFACLELVAAERTVSFSLVGRAFGMVLRGEVWAHMWYLYLAVFLYLITPALKWILKRVPLWSVWAVMAVFLVGSSLFFYFNKLLQADIFPVLPDTCIYLFYYLLGYLFARRDFLERSGEPVRGNCHWAKRLLPICLILLAAGMVISRLIAQEQVQMAYDYPFTVLFSALLFAWAWRRNEESVDLPEEKKKRNGAKEVLRRFRNMFSGISFAVYLIHPLFLNIAYKMLGLSPLNYPLWLSLPFFWLATLVLSLGTAWVLHRIKPLKKYVL